MLSDREIAAQADPQFGQHFLVSPEKLVEAGIGRRHPSRRRRSGGWSRYRHRGEGTSEIAEPDAGRA